MPAACAAVVGPDCVRALLSAGRHTYGSFAPEVLPTHLFDLASVTKVMATTTLCAILYEKGRLDLDQPAQEILPDCDADKRVTARSILMHASGYPAHVHLYKRPIDREEVIRAVCKMNLEYEPLSQSVYSDMGFILLGAILERLEDRPLNELFRHHLRDPLGLHETMFCPGPSARDRIVPTESDEVWRGRLVHGEVHDENASVMGGVAPHAGLFGTVLDCSRFAQMWLSEGDLDGRRILNPEMIRLFRSRANVVADSSWALGWDTVSQGVSTAGQYFSGTSYGSLGFTGTSIWIDPQKEIAVVLLTNRVHPTRENWQIKSLRPAFHDAVMAGLGFAS